MAKGIVENPDLILSGSECGITSLMIHKRKSSGCKADAECVFVCEWLCLMWLAGAWYIHTYINMVRMTAQIVSVLVVGGIWF